MTDIRKALTDLVALLDENYRYTTAQGWTDRLETALQNARAALAQPERDDVAYGRVHELVCDINEDRYGRPLTAALHLCLDLADELQTLLERQPATDLAPQPGMVLVPREPTREMLDAVLKETGAYVEPSDDEYEGGTMIAFGLSQEDADAINTQQRDALADDYRVMLAKWLAASQPGNAE